MGQIQKELGKVPRNIKLETEKYFLEIFNNMLTSNFISIINRFLPDYRGVQYKLEQEFIQLYIQSLDRELAPFLGQIRL